MTNNKLCDIIGCIGCVVCFFSMGLMFFGIGSAIWGAVVGLLICLLGLFNYD